MYCGLFVRLSISYHVSIHVVPFINGIHNIQHRICDMQCSNGQKSTVFCPYIYGISCMRMGNFSWPICVLWIFVFEHCRIFRVEYCVSIGKGYYSNTHTIHDVQMDPELSKLSEITLSQISTTCSLDLKMDISI